MATIYVFKGMVGNAASYYEEDSDTGEKSGIKTDESTLNLWYAVDTNGDEDDKKNWIGWPSKPKPQKDTELKTSDDIKISSSSPTKKKPFDLRLAKPRNGLPVQDPVLPFDYEEAKLAPEGLYPKPTAVDPADDTTEGVPSINSWYAVVTLSGAENDKSLFVDTEGRRRWYESDEVILNSSISEGAKDYAKEPTTSSLIQWGQLDTQGRVPYYYSDFAFCKYWRKIPNNRLITLRRYAMPTLASLEFPDFGPVTDTDGNVPEDPKKQQNRFTPVAQALTWFGEETGNPLSSLMSFSVKLPWEDMKSEVHDNTDSAEGAESLPSMFSGFAKTLSVLSSEATAGGARYDGTTPPDPYENGPYANRIKGPVNRIDTVKRRKPGLDFSHSITLNFHYNARSVGGINTKAAMLDLIANILLLTYGTGAFWGGANRFRGASRAYPWKQGMAAWYKGDPGGFFDAIGNSLEKAIGDISSVFENLLSDPTGTLTKIAGGAFGMMMAKNSGRVSSFHGLRALLTGEPVGEWHLTVGNPYNPIMMIGNLVCTGATFTFNDELGPDDFPTEMSVAITLEHGMGLDRSGVESMFNKGRGRIYTLPEGFEESFSSANETRVDENTGPDGNPYINKIMGVDSTGKNVGGNGNRMPRWWKQDADKDYKAFLFNSGKIYNAANNNSVTLAMKTELGYAPTKTKKD